MDRFRCARGRECPVDDAGPGIVVRCPACGRSNSSTGLLPPIEASAPVRTPEPTALEPVADDDGPWEYVPRYDARTGVALSPAVASPRRAALSRAMPGYRTRRPSILARPPIGLEAIPSELLRLGNLTVLLFIFVGQAVFNVVALVAASGIVILLEAPFILAALLLAHYGNVIDDVAREDRDELPAPLRQLRFREDLFDPFRQVAGALLVCFWPAAIVAGFAIARGDGAPIVLAAIAVAAGAGAICFPAVLLTFVCSGSIINLRPDRVLAVVSACAETYPATALFSLAGLGAYAVGMAGTAAGMLRLFGVSAPGLDRAPFNDALFCYGMLALGIYLSHVLCWRVGRAYRAHQPEFPWALQRFSRSGESSPFDPLAAPGVGDAPAPGRPEPK